MYRRILLKLSGEALVGNAGYGIDPEIVKDIARQVAEVHAMDVDIAIVVGGGNIFRGLAASAAGMDRATGDYMGMIATVLNALALKDALAKVNVDTRVQSAITMDAIAEPFIRGRALRHLEKKRVVILAAGTGNPYFTTDTAAALRAVELNCEVLLKATKVDGIYTEDPKRSATAKRYTHLTYTTALERNLQVMDSTAFALCKDNNLPIIVFSLEGATHIERAVRGLEVGTLVGANYRDAIANEAQTTV